MSAEIRKIATWVEETHREIGQQISPPTRKAVAVAVIKNPVAGSYTEDLTPLMDIGAELGGLLGDKCVAALGITPAQAESYGKAAMVGEGGELEHAAAILHPKLGAPLRVRGAVERRAARGRDTGGRGCHRFRAPLAPCRRADPCRGRRQGRPALEPIVSRAGPAAGRPRAG
jgi:hypothetical protein